MLIALAVPLQIYAADGTANNGYRPFTLRYQTAMNGKMITIGNTILVAPTDQTQSCADYTNGSYLSDAAKTNDAYILCAYHYDTSVTFPTTMAELTLPDREGVSIKWAGLYWQGLISNDYDITSMQIKLKHENDSSYTTIGYDQLDWGDSVGANGYISYSAFKDITYLAQSWKSGKIIAGDIPVFGGKVADLGTYGAWSLVIVYADPEEKVRFFSIYDGWQQVDHDYPDVNVHIEDFITPKQKPFSCYTSVFTAEGDKRILNDYLKVKPSKNDTWTTLSHTSDQTFYSAINTNPSFDRMPDPINNQGIDIQSFELGDGGYDIMSTTESSIDFKFGSDQDRYWPSMISFSIDLFTPDLCYDYAYKQNGRYFTEENDGSKNPRIKGALFSDAPINVSLYVKNRENSDFTITDLNSSIQDIDTAQATYIDNSVMLTPYGSITKQSVTPQSSGPSYINGIPIGDLGAQEYFYLYYDLDPKVFRVDMPLNAYLDYKAIFKLPSGESVTLPSMHQQLNKEIPLCRDGNFSYAPIYGTFNVEEQNLGYYNLFTQVARRVDNFQIKAYDANNTNTPVNISTIVAVELIDAGAFHETQTSCEEPTNILTPRVWVLFDDNVSSVDFTKETIENAIANRWVSDQIIGVSPLAENPMNEAEDYFSVVRRNTAFRISYVDMGDGESPLLDKNVNQNGEVEYTMLNWRTSWSGEDCVVDMATNGNGDDNRVSSYCNDTGNNPNELATCMECVYGKSVRYVCSRDNFAIRPEAFKISFADDNTTTLNADFANNTDKTGSADSPFNLVAGYPYRIDINATSHTDENPVTGYVQGFDSNDPKKRAYMAWAPTQTVDCNVPEDNNMSFYLVDGTNTNNNPINTWADRHDSLSNVGEYQFKVVDEEWTKYDWDPTLTQHHTGDYFISYDTPDCTTSSNDVPDVPSKVGCQTSSEHVSTLGATYSTMYIRSYPYAFNVANLNIGARPSNDASNNTFVYMNTLDKDQNYPDGYADREDENMSYNVQGTFTAVDHNVTGGFQRLSNFTAGCYADNVDMQLRYHYLPMNPADTLALRYDLIDYNTTDSSVVYRNRESNDLAADNTITQNASDFAKEMKGSITMDLGYNEPHTFNAPKNPLYVSMDDFNITDAGQPVTLYVDGSTTHKIYGNVHIDQNVTFIYGRAKTDSYLYTTSAVPVRTPVYVTAYCNLGLNECQNRGLVGIAAGQLADAQSNEAYWWIVENHNIAAGDGNITLTTQDLLGAVNPADPAGVTLNNGIDNIVQVTYNGNALPHTVWIDFANNTDRWLMFNADANTPPNHFYGVQINAAGGWTGEGQTGNVVGGAVNATPTKKLDW